MKLKTLAKVGIIFGAAWYIGKCNPSCTNTKHYGKDNNQIENRLEQSEREKWLKEVVPTIGYCRDIGFDSEAEDTGEAIEDILLINKNLVSELASTKAKLDKIVDYSTPEFAAKGKELISIY